MSTTTHAPPNLNHAAADLIEAIENLSPSPKGFRQGLQRTILYTRLASSEGVPEHAEARSALPVWEALDRLAEAIQNRKENR